MIGVLHLLGIFPAWEIRDKPSSRLDHYCVVVFPYYKYGHQLPAVTQFFVLKRYYSDLSSYSFVAKRSLMLFVFRRRFRSLPIPNVFVFSLFLNFARKHKTKPLLTCLSKRKGKSGDYFNIVTRSTLLSCYIIKIANNDNKPKRKFSVFFFNESRFYTRGCEKRSNKLR